MKNIKYKKKIICFIDKQETEQNYFKKLFSQDFDIITVSHISEIHILFKKKIELAVLISDEEILKSTGFEFLKQIKKVYPLCLFIITTAYANLHKHVKSIKIENIYQYISKPWDITHVKQILEDAILLFLKRKKDYELLNSKKKVMFSLASYIAHEIRTPLATIHSNIEGIKCYFPKLLFGYQKAKEHNLEIPTIRPAHLSLLQKSLSNIQDEVKHTHGVIDLLLNNAKDNELNKQNFKKYCIKNQFEIALKRYPFKEKQKEKIHCNYSNHFEFLGIEGLFSYVIFNLLKNAFYAMAGIEKAKIYISFKKGENLNYVFFRDTGKGISNKILPRIFDPFFTSKNLNVGSGIGLTFCKKVLQEFGGDLICRSEEHVFCEFILQFPTINLDSQDKI